MKLILSVVFILNSCLLIGQVPVSSGRMPAKEDPFIRYITALPSPENRRNIGFFEKVFNFITGYEPVIYNNPVNVSATGIQNIWILNQGDGSILRYIDGETRKVAAFTKKSSPFTSLVGICPFGKEGILFTDSRLNSVYLLSADGKQFRVFNDTATLERPTSIAYSDLKGEIWVVETGAHRISVYNKNGVRIKTIGKRGSGPLEFNFPTYIWIDGAGKIYIVDSMNFRVQILTSEGDYISSFGKQGDVTGTFARPRGVAADSKGNIYVIDALFNNVQIFDTTGRLLYYFGSRGRGESQFWMPSGIFIDKDDCIYVSDSYNGRVQIFQLIKNNQK
jgi:DNA-binding beta-propeller fold protein YncE